MYRMELTSLSWPIRHSPHGPLHTFPACLLVLTSPFHMNLFAVPQTHLCSRFFHCDVFLKPPPETSFKTNIKGQNLCKQGLLTFPLCTTFFLYIYHTHSTYIISLSLEKKMATHSSILARRIPCTEDPGQL